MVLFGSCNQTRSQDLEKGGGAILKEWEKCKRPWPEFLLVLNQFHTVCLKIQTNFLGKLGNSRFFPPKIRWSPKKRRSSPNWDWFSGRNRKFKGFFRPNSGGLQKKKKKKKRSSPKLRLIFRPYSKFQTFEGELFSYGGAIFNFQLKIGIKSPPPLHPPWLRYWLQLVVWNQSDR